MMICNQCQLCSWYETVFLLVSRFEWSRAEFKSWAEQLAEQHGYAVEFRDIGRCTKEADVLQQMELEDASGTNNSSHSTMWYR